MRVRGLVVAVITLWSASAAADGMVWLTRTAIETGFETADVLPEAQRAVFRFVPEDDLGLDGTWELTIQPRYQRPETGAVWLVPFPVCPAVREAEGAFLDELDLLTTPLFVEGCVQDCECEVGGGCWFAGAAGDEHRSDTDVAPQPPPDATVWQTGNIGPLDFVVLSAATGDDLVQWLDTNGYTVEAEVEDFAGEPGNEDLCYFAAKLAEPVADERSLPPVTFALDGLEDPVYPLRLTRLGMPGGDASLPIEIWFVVPEEPLLGIPMRSVSATSHPAGAPPCFDDDSTTPDGLEACIGEHLDSLGGLALTYSGPFSEHALAATRDGALCHASFAPLTDGVGSCLALERLFDEVPEGWSDALAELADTPYHVTRWEARFDAPDMDRDLVFDAGPTAGYWLAACGNDNACEGYFSGYLKGGVRGTAFHGVCRTMGDTKRCTAYCYDDGDCPSGWDCSMIENVYADPDGAVRACLPPDTLTPPASWETVAAAGYLAPVFTLIREGCGLDCDDVCDGKLEGEAQLLSTAGRGSPQRAEHVALLAGLVAALVVLRARARRSGAS